MSSSGSSVSEPCVGDLLDELEVLLGGGDAEPLAVFDEDQKRQDLGEPRKGGGDEGVLVAHVGDPGGQAVADGEGHGVADEDDGDDGLAGQVAVAVDTITNAELEADGVCEGDDAHCEDLDVLATKSRDVGWNVDGRRTNPNQ